MPLIAENTKDFRLSRVSRILIGIAAVHTLVWGLAVLFSSKSYFAFSGLNADLIVLKDETWGIFGVLGGLLYIASVVVPKQMGKAALVFFTINLANLALMLFWAFGGTTTPLAGAIHILGDIAGVVGFGLAAYEQYRWKYEREVEQQYFEGGELKPTLQEFTDQSGKTLDALNREKPVLIVFLRHFGCTFCREALADLSKLRGEIEKNGVQIALVHMVDDATAAHHIAKYGGLDDVARISDPEKRLYEAFGLARGNFSQLFGLKEWIEGFRAGILNGHLIGRETGDGFQMPGVFLIQNGHIRRGFRHKNAADRPDYCLTADCDQDNASSEAATSATIP
ncbi:MAG: peroxiredoxin-like family protein [Bacteroidota bacterium]